LLSKVRVAVEQSQEESLENLQAIVSRKLGSCILRLQHYEKLMKFLLAHTELSGYADEIEVRRSKRKEDVGRKTLGQLVGELTDSYLNGEETNPQGEVGEDDSTLDPTRAHIKVSCSVELDKEEYQRTKEGLSQLVALRNELVHHFLDRFDLWDGSDCQSAQKYLDDASQIIGTRLDELQGWAKSMQEIRKDFAKIVNTTEFKNWFTYGILPDGEIDWSSADIVHQLLHEEREHSVDGWTDLSNAMQNIREGRPDITPAIYGCRSWRQVLHESRLFDIQKRKDADSGAGETWYRSRPVKI
jgi:hypothetical protein